MTITTNELEKTLQTDVKENYVHLTKEYKQLLMFLEEKMKENNITRAALIKMLNLGMTNGYKYFNGELKLKRDQLISCLIIFELNIEEIQNILKMYEYKYLYVKNKRDQIIYNCVCNNFNLEQVNTKLSQNGCLKLC